MKLNRDFVYHGYEFHLNDYRNNFTDELKRHWSCKYKLIYFDQLWEEWIEVGYCDTKQEAIRLAKNLYLSCLRYD